MLPDSFAGNTGITLLYALGVVATFGFVALPVNVVLGQVLKLLVRRHESPLLSVEIRMIGARVFLRR